MKLVSQTLPNVRIPERRKLELEEELRACNALLHETCPESSSKSQFLSCLYSRFSGSDVEVDGVVVDASTAKRLLSIKEMEWEILCGFSGMIKKAAFKFSGISDDCSLSYEDCESEAIRTVINALPHFTRGSVRLSTFLHVCMQRHLSRTLAQYAGTPDSVLKIRKRYESLISEEGANFSSVVERMGLDEDQVERLVDSLKKVKNGTTLDRPESEFAVVEDGCRAEGDILKAAREADLSELERAVLDGFLTGGDGLGLSELSKNLINPKTKKPYSRMAFSLAWKRAREKIAAVYGKTG